MNEVMDDLRQLQGTYRVVKHQLDDIQNKRKRALELLEIQTKKNEELEKENKGLKRLLQQLSLNTDSQIEIKDKFIKKLMMRLLWIEKYFNEECTSNWPDDEEMKQIESKIKNMNSDELYNIDIEEDYLGLWRIKND